MDTEKRNVELTLEKAKEWYKKGGELKEVALQAFKKEELIDKPRSWNEYCDMFEGQKVWYIDNLSDISVIELSSEICDDENRNTLPTEQMAKAFIAFMQLMSLRQAWIGKWEPNWNGDGLDKWCINLVGNMGIIFNYSQTCHPLSFPTKEMAEEFLDCFKDLLEKAKGLY